MKTNRLLPIGLLAALAACKSESKVDTGDPNRGFELASIDSSYAPCNDFFHFSAQGWLDANPIPETETSWGRFSILGRENEKRVRAIFDELVNAEEPFAQGSDEQLVGDLYVSGMDSLQIEEAKFAPVQGMVNEMAHVTSVDEWFKLASQYQNLGVTMPISARVSSDDKNAGMNILHIGQSGLGMPDRQYYVAEDSMSLFIQQKYREHIASMLHSLGATEDLAKASADDIYAFEKSLAMYHLTREERRDPDTTYNKMSMEELKALAPGVPFDTYFEAKGIKPEVVIVTSIAYIDYLGSAVQNWDLKTLEAYSVWQIINSYASTLHHEAVMADFNFFEKTLQGRQKMQPRWRRVQNSMRGLQEQIGHLYVDRYFPAEHKARIEGMVEDLRSAFRVRINNLEWMSGETKEKALEKLEAFTYKIGYPDEWKDWSDLAISREGYTQNMMTLSQYMTNENLAKMDQPVDRGEWYMGAHIVNAYYNPNNNEVVFPAGILQPPFFMPDADDAINYGAIGGVIGHEFTHGFDDQGSKYDKDGNLNSWWTDEDRARFEELTQRVVAQYDGYEALPGEYVNGGLTLGENIADLGGLTLAYHAYLLHMEGEERPAPIGGFTDGQRVFLGWAQVWQVDYREEALRYRLNNDVHSPGMFRVIGPMSNIPEFWEEFGCGEGEEMHLPEDEHALIW
ncbi:MAG: M13 family metallopeptidase [Flavobacteriia bacterium]|nr:M13 family metallopeptidase [Flavobacteriia bacterium]